MRHAEGLKFVALPAIADGECWFGVFWELKRVPSAECRVPSDANPTIIDLHFLSGLQNDLERLRLRRTLPQDPLLATAQELDIRRDADALQGRKLVTNALQIGCRDFAALRIEAADVPEQQGAAKPRLRWKRLKSRFVCRRCTRVDVVQNSLEDHPLLPRLTGDRREIVDRCRIEFGEHAPNAVAQKSRIRIRTIDTSGNPALAQEGLDVSANDLQQWANDAVVAHGMDSAQSGKPAAGDQAHENGFGLIVLLMGGCDVRRSDRSANLVQTRVPHVARSSLDAVAANALWIQRAVGDVQRHAKAFAELASKGFVRV